MKAEILVGDGPPNVPVQAGSFLHTKGMSRGPSPTNTFVFSGAFNSSSSAWERGFCRLG